MAITALALVVVIILTAATFPVSVGAQNATLTTVLMNDPRVTYGFNAQPLSFEAFTTTFTNNWPDYGIYGANCDGFVVMCNATGYIRFSFTGTSITTNLIYDREGGLVQTFLDGAAVSLAGDTLANADAPDQCEMNPVVMDGLDDGPHTLELLKQDDERVVYVHSFVYSSTETDPALGSTTTTGLSTATSATITPTSSDFQSLSPSLSIAPSASSSSLSTAATTTSKGPNVAIIASIIAGLLLLLGLILVFYLLRRRRQARPTNIPRSGPGILDDDIHDPGRRDQKSPRYERESEYGMNSARLAYDLNPFAIGAPSSSSSKRHAYCNSSSTLVGGAEYGYHDKGDRPYPLSGNQPLPPRATKINSFRLPPPTGVTAIRSNPGHHTYSDSKVSLNTTASDYIPLQPPQPSYAPASSSSPSSHHSSHSTSTSTSTTETGEGSGSVGSTKASLKTTLAQQELVRGLLARGLSAAEIAAALRVVRVGGGDADADGLQGSTSGFASNAASGDNGSEVREGARKSSAPPPRYTYAVRSGRP